MTLTLHLHPRLFFTCWSGQEANRRRLRAIITLQYILHVGVVVMTRCTTVRVAGVEHCCVRVCVFVYVCGHPINYLDTFGERS